ncbi:hypothetical protein G5S34_20555 [Herbaspirillum frisingense]|uniref:hypothetical protein n=1 Tax=Herbaspirillum frisingense TaxID=92645 RepID=UPI0015FEDEAB|nr:hypothetical protein [Herbaspirillum frisingense]QNB08908.1 hypothetical protein G5S34_20555 [Herbaspirillum frisingense]
MVEKKKQSRKGNDNASMTNRTKKSLVEVVVRTDDRGEWVKPDTLDKFFIDEEAVFPSIEFEFKTEAPGPYLWAWKMTWSAKVSGLSEKDRGRELETYKHEGSITQEGKSWNARSIGKVIGGILTVTVTVGTEKFIRTVGVLAKQPGKERIVALIRKNNEPLMEKAIAQESRFKHVRDKDCQPIVSGDRGFGAGQLTIKPPTYEQIWSWRINIEESISRLREKRAIANAYLKSKGGAYTPKMLDLETVTRWNGGKYHEWDEASDSWGRTKKIQCDTQTGNIGWDMEKEANTGKSEEELRERDKDSYNKMKKGQDGEHQWKYSGVCYADHLLKN